MCLNQYFFQVERLAEFHCACQSYSLPSNSSSFTYLFGESRTQKCRIRFPEPTLGACVQHVNNYLVPLRLPCVRPDCATLSGASTAQIAESSLQVGLWPKGQHGRELRLHLLSLTEGLLALHHPSSLCSLKTCLILSDGCKCAFQCHRLA